MKERAIQNKLRCVIIGAGTLPLRCGEILIGDGHELCALVSTDKKVEKWGSGHVIPVYRSGAELLAELREPFDYLFSIVNDQILREDILDLPRKWAINYHDGPLPRYAGTHATSWALMNHERRHAISWHLVTGVVDAGDILKQKHVDIADDETAHSLNTKCYEAAALAFGELVADLSTGNVQPQCQNLTERTFFPRFKRPARGGMIRWNSPAREISALIRALDFGPHPNPLGTAKMAIGDSFLIVSEVDIPGTAAESSPGTVNEIGDDFLRVSSLDKEVVVRHFRHPDGQPAAITDLAPRFSLRTGDVLRDPGQEECLRIETGIDETCRSETYWVRKLAGLDPAVPAFAAASGMSVSGDYREASFSLPDEFRGFVQRSENSGSLGLHTVAAFGGFLSRLNDKEQFDIGFCDLSVRSAFANLEGLFVEQVPFRFDVDGRQHFDQLLKSTEAELEAVRKHKVFSRDISVRYPEVGPQAESKIPAEYPVNVVLTSGQADPLIYPDGEITLIVDEESKCRLVYDKNAFGEREADRLIEYFNNFLKGIAAEADRSLEHLPLLSEEEADLLLFGLNSDIVEVPNDLCVHHLFEAQVESTPDNPALIAADRRLTYRELDERAERVADRLRALGVGPDVLVAICAERSVEMVAGILGILKAGGAYVPLDPAYPKARLDQILDDSRAGILLTQSKVSDKLGKTAATVILIDEGVEAVERSPRPAAFPTVKPDNLAYVIYTSGSTGKPKGVAIEHRNTVAFLTWATSVFSVEKLKGTVASTSVCFDLSVFEIFAPLSCGGTIILVENILHLPSSAPAGEATLINTVPSAIAELLKMGGIPDSVSTVNLAGEPLKTSLVERIYETGTVREVFDLYGPTEDTTYSTYTLRTGGRATIGRPISNTQAYILDRNLRPVPPGISGELYLGGDGLARGYLNQPEMTAGRFIANPFKPDSDARMYKTGDLVRYLPSFEIEYLGRIDNQVKIRGFRIELGEIETVLLSHPSVDEAVVVARDDGGREKRLAAYFVTDRKKGIRTSDLREHIKKALPDFMIPSAFVELDELPLTPNGKLDRKALPAPTQSIAEDNRNYLAPRNDVESQLVRIWERLLSVSPIGIRDDFFELGGDSLVSVSLFVEIENEFGAALPLSALIGSPTIEKLAAELGRDGASASWKYLIPLQTEGERTPLFCMHAAGGNVLFYRDLASELGTGQPFYGLQARGVAHKSETAHDRVEDMARDYLKEIRSLQPTGPYNFCGSSFGGLVAFEAARQIVAMGETVGTLALFDTYAPGYLIPVSQTAQNGRLQSMLFRVKSVRNQIAAIENWRMRVDFVRSKAAKLHKRMKRKIAWTKNQFAIEYNKATGRELPPNMMRNHAAIQEAMDRYMPEKFEGDLLLFRASEQPVENIDRHLGWGEFVSGAVTPVVVKGSHGSLTVYPYATDLAAKLGPFLECRIAAGSSAEIERDLAA